MIKLEAALVDKIWGGSHLKDKYGKKTSLTRIGESWEVSSHPNGMSIVKTGPYKGLMFDDYLERIGKEALGTHCINFDKFPILIKLIDAKEALSIQVHPNDNYAKQVEHAYGKTEMWIVLDCEEDSFLYYGVNDRLTKDAFRKHIEDNTILSVLNKVPVKVGDVFFMAAGTIHAIGTGIVICEIQQNSDTTYRVYDFNRKDDNGNFRELHIEKAMDVSCLEPTDKKVGSEGCLQKLPGGSAQLMATCPYFTTYDYHCEKTIEIPVTQQSFLALLCIEGHGTLRFKDEELIVEKGESLFIPAEDGTIKVTGSCRLIGTTV